MLSFKKISLSRETVNWGFKTFLDRDISNEPDDAPGIISHQKLGSVEKLVEVLISSNEFQSKLKKTNSGLSAGQKDAVYHFVSIGNCQALRISEILLETFPYHGTYGIELLPDNVYKMHAGDYNSVLKNARTILIIGSADHPISRFVSSVTDVSKISYIPAVSFAGFHPDNDYIINKNTNKPISGPLGHYQSMLIFWGWKNGFSITETERLFSSEMFEAVGYYDLYQSSHKALLDRFKSYPYPLEQAFLKWRSRGCFMHSVNHPKLYVLADLARIFLEKAGYKIPPDIETYVPDQFTNHGCWPVYPEIGERLSIEGSYSFKKAGKEPVFLTLPEFIEQSFAVYSEHNTDDLDCPRLNHVGFKDLLPLARDVVSRAERVFVQGAALASNPYKGLPDHNFWKRGVSLIARDSLDPVISPRFVVGKGELVATAGSCFAQHIAKRLSSEGFNYYVPEDGASLSESECAERNYGVFSCRYGNLYTTRQLVQLLDRSMGRFIPKETAWQRADGKYVDPFRPQTEPEGFESINAMEASRRMHLNCVKEMFEKLDILIFTLGLTESWESHADGAVFPLAPGVAGGAMDPTRYRYRNLTAKEVADDLELFLLKLQGVNPKARVILTVSPVPLIATFEKRHVLVSNTHSKSVLRTVAGEMASRYSQCDYFPSYEIITGQHVGNGYLEEDLRSVRPEGVDHVMRVFLKHYAGKVGSSSKTSSTRESEQRAALERINDIICDEEAIERNS